MEFFVRMPLFLALFLVIFPANSNQIRSHTVQLYSETGQSTIDDVTVTIRNGIAYTQGDIIVGYVDSTGTVITSNSIDDTSVGVRLSGVSTTTLGRHWVDGVVPYDLSGVTTSTAVAVRMAMDTIESVSGVRFISRVTQSDYVTFAEIDSEGSLCAAQVGRQGGAQIVQLASYCRNTTTKHQGVIIHELFHVLGFFHEHTRADRDNYLTIHYSNLTNEGVKWLEKKTTGFSYLTSYDHDSIMHYGRYSSNLNYVYDKSTPVFSRVDDLTLSTGSDSMSPKDREGLRKMYGVLPKPVLNAYPFYCYGEVELSWKSESNADYFRLEYFDSSYSPIGVQTLRTNYLIVTDANQSRYYRVKSCTNTNGCSKASSSIYVHYYSECL